MDVNKAIEQAHAGINVRENYRMVQIDAANIQEYDGCALWFNRMLVHDA